MTIRIAGSSPLARGLPCVRALGGGVHRIIPARAGFTRRTPLRGLLRRDHPRSRGVYLRPYLSLMRARGSSPLARGLHVQEGRRRRVRRIIPARAGFTQNALISGGVHTDHPRSRGVYAEPDPVEAALRGSSPLARGLHNHSLALLGVDGIIPARAGFTQNALISGGVHTDHPRSRGVYAEPDPVEAALRGSSPLARGLRWCRCLARVRVGIIPARAGFTRPSRRPWSLRSDHPRSRGVYPGPGRGRHGHLGIIPARAGFTRPSP